MIVLLLICASNFNSYTAIPIFTSTSFKGCITVSNKLLSDNYKQRDGGGLFTKTYAKKDDFDDEFDDLLREKLNRLPSRDTDSGCFYINPSPSLTTKIIIIVMLLFRRTSNSAGTSHWVK